jgi:hypothetical protein
MKITDELILICEFIHDNAKEDKKAIYGNEFFDFFSQEYDNGKITPKIVKIEKRKQLLEKYSSKDGYPQITNPEEFLKEILMRKKDFFYNDEKFITQDDIRLIDDKNTILVFDNMADENKILMCSLKEMKYKRVYIPFILLCENTITDNDKCLYDTYVKKKENIEKVCDDHFEVINESIYVVKPELNMFENKKLTEFYKKYARYIGYNYESNEMIDYNFVHKEFLIKNDVLGKATLTANISIKPQINKFIEFCELIYRDDIEMYNVYFKFGDINKLTFDKICNTIDFINNVKRLVYSMKEMRDTLYFIEMVYVLNRGRNAIYITSDEISCMRCVLYGIKMLNYYGSVFRYGGFRNKENKYCVKLFNPTYHFLRKMKFEMNGSYGKIVKKYKQEFGYILGKSTPIFMNSKDNIGGSLMIDYVPSEIMGKNFDSKIYIKESEVPKKMLLEAESFYDDFGTVIFTLSKNIEETKEKISKNDKEYVELYNKFKKAYDELFILTQIKEDEIEKYVCSERIESVKRHLNGESTSVYDYIRKRKCKHIDGEKMEMYMILTYYDYVHFTNFEDTQKLLEVFYSGKANELNIDFKMIKDIFNLQEDEKKERKKKLLKMYEAGLLDEAIDEYEEHKDESDNDDD